MKYFNTLYKSVIEKKSYSIIKGYDESEIHKAVDFSKKKLPESYIEFLTLMGRKSAFLGGGIYSINSLPILKEEAMAIMNISNKKFVLKDNDFVFWADGGIAFAYFNLDEGENPPVYGFISGQISDKCTEVSSNFSNFINSLHNGENIWAHLFE